MKRLILQLTLFVAVLLSASCAPQSRPQTNAPANPTQDAARIQRRVEAAKFLSSRGAHFEASFHLEAALDAGGKERQLLPVLVASQIRANRLRAARQNLQRLMAIAPEHPHARELHTLLSSLAPSEAGPQAEEVYR